MGRVLTLNEIAPTVAAERAAGHRIVLTNGCFDLIHVGHVRVLQQCRALGDVLVVGVNGDASVRQLKGPPRPLVPALDRAEIIAALAAVDYVTVFPETTAEQLATLVQPDVYVKGADYARSTDPPIDGAQASNIDEGRLPEAKVVRAHGGRVVLLPLTAGISTTRLIERVGTASGEGDESSPPAGP